MDILKLTDWNDKEPLTGNIEELLEPLIDYAVKAGIIEDTAVQRDLFDTRAMGCLLYTSQIQFWRSIQNSRTQQILYDDHSNLYFAAVLWCDDRCWNILCKIYSRR